MRSRSTLAYRLAPWFGVQCLSADSILAGWRSRVNGISRASGTSSLGQRRIVVAATSALIVVDMQVDFCQGGALPVSGACELIPTLNELTDSSRRHDIACFFSRDWHPSTHRSFVEHGGEWPPHCVQETAGATFEPSLLVPESATIISKGLDSALEGYSAFEETPLGSMLAELKIEELAVCGVATEVCVRASVLDALRLGLRTLVLRDAIAAIEARSGDGDRALAEMEREGAHCIASRDWLR